MAKVPYLFRRKNVYYFRYVVPVELRETLKVREIIKSLKTQDRELAVPLALQIAANVTHAVSDIRAGRIDGISSSELTSHSKNAFLDSASVPVSPLSISSARSQAPLLSVVISDFLSRYDTDKKATLTKLRSTLPVFLELIGDRPVNQILQADVNTYFDLVQKLPVRRDANAFRGMSIQEVIATHSGRCIAKGTFDTTYRATVSLFVNWAIVHYKDQGFPSLSVDGGIYRGTRKDGINKQRAFSDQELKTLFEHVKMHRFAANADKAHCCWLPLIGLYTGARLNEICQLNPFEDILQDKDTGIHYFHFTADTDTAEGVIKSIKTNSSRRIVPIHSKMLELGFLDYVERVRSDKHKLIFPSWPPNHGKASAKVSKWFINYVRSLGLRDDTECARLSGFHCFRHTFVTYGIKNKIRGIFAITGHETSSVDGIGAISNVAMGYFTKGQTENIVELQSIIERYEFGIKFYRPT